MKFWLLFCEICICVSELVRGVLLPEVRIKGSHTSMSPGSKGLLSGSLPIALVFQAWCFSLLLLVRHSLVSVCVCLSYTHTPSKHDVSLFYCWSITVLLVCLSLSLSHIHTPSMVFLSFIVDPSQSCLSVTYTHTHTHTHTHTLQVQCFSLLLLVYHGLV